MFKSYNLTAMNMPQWRQASFQSPLHKSNEHSFRSELRMFGWLDMAPLGTPAIPSNDRAFGCGRTIRLPIGPCKADVLIGRFSWFLSPTLSVLRGGSLGVRLSISSGVAWSSALASEGRDSLADPIPLLFNLWSLSLRATRPTRPLISAATAQSRAAQAARCCR